jgi:hypothetical protein
MKGNIYTINRPTNTKHFPGVKRPECGIDHLSPSSTEVKERVELYLCYPSEPSQPHLGGNFYQPTLLINTPGGEWDQDLNGEGETGLWKKAERWTIQTPLRLLN